jgi:hypothetical protein
MKLRHKKKTMRFICYIMERLSVINTTLKWGSTNDAPPSSLMDSITSPKVKTTEGDWVRVHSLVRNISGVEGRDGAPRWD